MSGDLSLQLFVDLSQCLHGQLFMDRDPFSFVGKGLRPLLSDLLDELGVGETPLIHGEVAEGAFISGRVYIAAGAVVEPCAYIKGPCYIGPEAEVRHGAYIRGDVYAGPKSVIGHTTEVKGSIFFDGAKAGHFAYVGDAILGRNVNLGAGTKLANLALNRGSIKIRHPKTNAAVDTKLKKFSAIMGDNAQTGCNAVLSPGTLLMPNTAVWPCAHFRGTLTSGTAK